MVENFLMILRTLLAEQLMIKDNNDNNYETDRRRLTHTWDKYKNFSVYCFNDVDTHYIMT